MITSFAEEVVGITPTLTNVETTINGTAYRIYRNQDNTNLLDGIYRKTSRPCPPYCIQPIKANTKVETIGELELIENYNKNLIGNKTLLLDVREPEWYLLGSLPGSAQIPLSIISIAFEQNNLQLMDKYATNQATIDVIKSFKLLTNTFNPFLEYPTIIIFSNGNWDSDSYSTIQLLINKKYPAEKIHWYRGGVQDWLGLGFKLTQAR